MERFLECQAPKRAKHDSSQLLGPPLHPSRYKLQRKPQLAQAEGGESLKSAVRKVR
jgi:hypothetical protein